MKRNTTIALFYTGELSLPALAAAALIVAGCGGGNTSSPQATQGDGYPGTDDQLLEEIEKAAFLFFWEQADPTTGQVKDRALAAAVDRVVQGQVVAPGDVAPAADVGCRRGGRPGRRRMSRDPAGRHCAPHLTSSSSTDRIA